MQPESRRALFALSTIGLLLVLNIVSAVKSLGWRAVTCNTALILLLDLLYIWRYRDAQVAQWLLLGLTAGWVELWTDAWLVRTGTLAYPPNEPMVAASPLYMPFAWAMVLTQIGIIGGWLRRRYPLLLATLLTALLSGINIPIYEHLAKDANWWFYQHTPMVFQAPYYVICAEFLLALPLAWMADGVAKLQPTRSVALGIVEGVWMFPVTVFAFMVLGSCTEALIRLPCP